jgi:hypothetical protein
MCSIFEVTILLVRGSVLETKLVSHPLLDWLGMPNTVESLRAELRRAGLPAVLLLHVDIGTALGQTDRAAAVRERDAPWRTPRGRRAGQSPACPRSTASWVARSHLASTSCMPGRVSASACEVRLSSWTPGQATVADSMRSCSVVKLVMKYGSFRSAAICGSGQRVPRHSCAHGVRQLFRLRTRLGRELKATVNHPFLTIDGWVPLQSLSPGCCMGTSAANHDGVIQRQVAHAAQSEIGSNEPRAAIRPAIGDGTSRPLNQADSRTGTRGRTSRPEGGSRTAGRGMRDR